jgi:hypothetical protein
MNAVVYVRPCRNNPEIEEFLSRGVATVRQCRTGMWDGTWDFRFRTGEVRSTSIVIEKPDHTTLVPFARLQGPQRTCKFSSEVAPP